MAAGTNGTCRRSVAPDLQAETDDACERRLAGCFLAIAEHLPEKRPQYDRGAVNTIPTEQPAVLAEDAIDLLSGQHRCERQQ